MKYIYIKEFKRSIYWFYISILTSFNFIYNFVFIYSSILIELFITKKKINEYNGSQLNVRMSMSYNHFPMKYFLFVLHYWVEGYSSRPISFVFVYIKSEFYELQHVWYFLQNCIKNFFQSDNVFLISPWLDYSENKVSP